MGVIYLNGISYAGGGSSGGQTIQVATLPAPSADQLDKIYQYIGTTNANYVNGYFYKCINNNGVYIWEQKNTQPSGGSGGSSDYEDLSNKPSINGHVLVGNSTLTDIGLGNINNTSDADKPISNATQAALDNLESEIDTKVSCTIQGEQLILN